MHREALLEISARQYEPVRVDEGRESRLIQVLNPALPPKRQNGPRRALIALSATLVSVLHLGGFALIRAMWRVGEPIRDAPSG